MLLLRTRRRPIACDVFGVATVRCTQKYSAGKILIWFKKTAKCFGSENNGASTTYMISSKAMWIYGPILVLKWSQVVTWDTLKSIGTRCISGDYLSCLKQNKNMMLSNIWYGHWSTFTAEKNAKSEDQYHIKVIDDFQIDLFWKAGTGGDKNNCLANTCRTIWSVS